MNPRSPFRKLGVRVFLLCQIPVFVFLGYVTYSIPAQMAAERRAEVQRQQQERLAGKTPTLRVQCGNPMLASIFAAGLMGVMLFTDSLLLQVFRAAPVEEVVRNEMGSGE